MSPHDRLRPRQAHYAVDHKPPTVFGAFKLDGSTEGELWTRQHSSMHSSRTVTTKLPHIVSPQSTLSRERRGDPMMGTRFASDIYYISPDKSATNVTDWKKDDDTKAWYKVVCQRKKETKAKQLRQANKDAQWILDRRERQMKEIQKITKAEREAAALHEKMQEEASKSRRVPAGLNKAKPTEAATIEGEQAPGVQYTGGGVGSIANDQLQWQDIPEASRNKDKQHDVAVWVKPGVFITKTCV